MKIKYCLLVIFMLPVAFGHSGARTIVSQTFDGAPGDVTMEARLSNLNNVIDGPVEIALTIINRSSSSISLNLGAEGASDLEIILTLPNRTIVPVPTDDLSDFHPVTV